jgi:tetratricopeptide (TPR) repeat protein
LEQAAGPGDVLIGEATYKLVQNAVTVEQIEPVAAKGKADPVPARRLVSVDATAAGFARRMDAPLIGRESELALLAEAYERAVRERRCHLFTLMGLAGAGKSRLIAEFLTLHTGAATVLRGHCLSYGEGITFWPLAEIARGAAGITEEDTAATARSRLDGLLMRADAPDAAAVAERVAWAIGLDAPAAGGDEIAWAARKLFEWLAADDPLVVVFEDVHWAEPTLLDLIDAVTDLSRGAAMLVICTARPDLIDARPGWSGGKTNATSILLEPLSDTNARRLIESHPEATGLNTQRRNQIVAAAEGNPLFVEQMLATVTDGSGGVEVVVPRTIQALLAARVDGLAADERRVLGHASVEGRVFHPSAVADLAGDLSRAELTTLLHGLVRRELIGPEPATFGGDEAFRFQHQLIRDAAYAHMSKRERADLHERFASWLERRVGERTAEYEEIVGYHLERSCRLRSELNPGGGAMQSGVALRAGRMLASAGRRALDRGDAPSAIGLMSRARELIHDPPAERCQLLLDLSRAHTWNMEDESAGVVARDALLLSSELGDAGLLARAEIAEMYAQPAATAAGVDSLIETLTALDDEWGLAHAWELRMGAAQARMHGDLAVVAAENVVVHARRSNQRTLELETLLELAGQSVWGATPVPEAIARCQHAVDAAAGDPRRRAKLTSMIAALEAMQGNFARAGALRSDHQAIDADLGTRVDVFYQAQFWATVDALCGDHAAAEAILRASIVAIDADADLIAVNRDMMAQAILSQGRFDEADALARESEHAASLPSDAFGAVWRRIRARVLAHRGRCDEAVQLALAAAALMATTDYLHDRADTQLDLAIVLRAAGRRDDAANAARDGVRLWEMKGNTVSAAAARAEFGIG